MMHAECKTPLIEKFAHLANTSKEGRCKFIFDVPDEDDIRDCEEAYSVPYDFKGMIEDREAGKDVIYFYFESDLKVSICYAHLHPFWKGVELMLEMEILRDYRLTWDEAERLISEFFEFVRKN